MKMSGKLVKACSDARIPWEVASLADASVALLPVRPVQDRYTAEHKGLTHLTDG
jgi:hypothetical protein